jgi:DNA-binding ferritin-like protein
MVRRGLSRKNNDMISEAFATVDKIIHELHLDTESVSQEGDIGTADLFTRSVQVYQSIAGF